MDRVLTRPDHSLIDQSLLARKLVLQGSSMTAQFRQHDMPTNGDGFGVAWLGDRGTLGRYRDTSPAWNDKNLHRLVEQIESACFLAHVRAAFGATVSRSNTHPFVHDGWMFQHNGGIGGFHELRRDLVIDIDPALFPYLEGNSDTEVCFFLALTYGLADDPVRALTRMVERIERARAERGVQAQFRATIAASNGHDLVVLRYASPIETYVVPPSLFRSIGPETLHLRSGIVEHLPEDAQIVVSEPLELHYSRRRWAEIPDRSITVLREGVEPQSSELALEV
jgi:glutamine amidotransferase